MRKKLKISESDLAKFPALLGFPSSSGSPPRVSPLFLRVSAHRRRNSLRACSARQRARGRHKSTRGATVSSHAEFHMLWPLGVLNRGTERRESDEECTPSNSNRARRRTKLEVHGDARTRPVSARLQKRKETPSRTVPGPLLSPFKAPSGVRAREGRELSDSERAFSEVPALCDELRASLGRRREQGMGNKHVSWIQDLKSLSNGVQCRLST